MTKKRVAIVGAGITGLVAAYYLKKAKIDFRIYERSPHIGGVINTIDEDGFLYETGPNSGVISNKEIANLFESLNGKCNVELADHSSARRLIWKKDQWHALPSGLLSAVFTPLFSWYDKFRILGEPFRKKGNNPNETLASLVKRRMGKSFLNYAIDPFILGIYAGDPDYIVPKYALPKLYNLEQDYGSFIGGAIKKRKEPKDEEAKKATREIFSIEGGLINLVKGLVDEIGRENIVTNCNDIHFHNDGNYYQLKFDTNNIEEFSHVVTTSNASELESIFPFLEGELLEDIANLTYARVTEITLGFKKWKGMQLNAFGGLVPYRENRDILGVLFMSTLFKDRAPKDGALLTVFVGGTRKTEIACLKDHELKDLMAKELSEMLQLKEFEPDLFIATKYKRAIAQYGADSGKRLAAINYIENKYKGLYLAGSMRDGVGIADRVKQARDIANLIFKE